MGMDKNIMYVISFFLGMLIFHLLKDYCGCNNVVEGGACSDDIAEGKTLNENRCIKCTSPEPWPSAYDRSSIDESITDAKAGDAPEFQVNGIVCATGYHGTATAITCSGDADLDNENKSTYVLDGCTQDVTGCCPV